MFVYRCASKLNSKSTGNTSNVVTYANLKKIGMVWALRDSEEVRSGYRVCIVAYVCRYVQVKFLASVGTYVQVKFLASVGT